MKIATKIRQPRVVGNDPGLIVMATLDIAFGNRFITSDDSVSKRVAQWTHVRVRKTSTYFVISRSLFLLEITGEEEVMIFRADQGAIKQPDSREVGNRSFQSVEEALTWLAERVAILT